MKQVFVITQGEYEALQKEIKEIREELLNIQSAFSSEKTQKERFNINREPVELKPTSSYEEMYSYWYDSLLSGGLNEFECQNKKGVRVKIYKGKINILIAKENSSLVRVIETKLQFIEVCEEMNLQPLDTYCSPVEDTDTLYESWYKHLTEADKPIYCKSNRHSKNKIAIFIRGEVSLWDLDDEGNPNKEDFICCNYNNDREFNFKIKFEEKQLFINLCKLFELESL
jgi:hypothetical protein